MKKNYLHAKWLNEEMNEEELAAFQASDDYELYEKIKIYSSQLEVADFNEEKIIQKIISRKKTKTKQITLYTIWFSKIAAILIIVLGLFYSVEKISIVNQITDNGEKRTFLLPDHSEVVLNSGSEVNYKKWNWNTNRELKLNGEAYFAVTKGKKFKVKTKLGIVTVLGTHFNVKTKKNQFNVTCFEGRVKVNYQKAQLILTSGQSVTFENGKQTNTTSQITKPIWIDNQMSFQQEKLTAIITEIEKQYNVTIIIKTKNTENVFSGKIPTNNLDTALQIISTTYNLNYSIAKDQIIFEEK
ncbi:FecR family protein [Flavobacterium muglaense]|uniref:FecR family protein n=1 Tax=Flavobacterium muglaense TaxID=2764716 RepID=A0A923MZ13_9FLAO|nr:FecR family protein [Flavobacterium muglaense]MBC5837311.1 FecR family protein [Flavobacterium muglaense]MBC5843765.1 FecR family protein [Flavobacterium muglaense]